MSIDDRRVGGYTGYLYDEIFTDLAENYSINIKGFMSWAKDVMTQCCFKQIHSVFHPELCLQQTEKSTTNIVIQ